MESITNEKLELKAFMNMFVAIKKLMVYYTLDQAIDVLDIYFKANDDRYLTTQNDIRNFVVNSHMREIIFPLVDGNYNHLMDFVDELCSSNNNKKNR